MPKRVQLPDGSIGEFPDSMNDSQIESVLQRQFPSVAPSPKKWSWEDIKNRAMTLRDTLVNNLPGAGGMAGGLIGGAAGAESGPGAVGTAVIGAGAGGALGEDARQYLNQHFHPEDRKMGPLESSLRIIAAGGGQAAQEATGRLAGKVIGRGMNAIGDRFVPEAAFAKYPILKDVFAVGETKSPKATQHLTAAASGKGPQAGVTLEAINNTLGELEGEIRNLPKSQRTVEGFLNAVNLRKDAMNAESGIAMMPIRGKEANTLGIANSIRGLGRSYMANTPEGRAQLAYLKKRATAFEKPGWTYGALDEMRTDLSSQLAKHNAKGSVAKYTAEKGDLDLAIDNAILNGLRETVYPEMDRAAGKPSGYFEQLKGRQSSLITLQSILDKRVSDLKGSQAVSEVASRFSHENISVSAHPGSLPRAGLYGLRNVVAPTREMNAASKHVAKAFPSVNSMPYQILLSGEIRASQLQGPKTKNIQRIADDARSNTSQ